MVRVRDGELKPMDAEQLREYGHKMVDFIADYYKNIENLPVLSQVQVLSISFSLLFPTNHNLITLNFVFNLDFFCGPIQNNIDIVTTQL